MKWVQAGAAAIAGAAIVTTAVLAAGRNAERIDQNEYHSVDRDMHWTPERHREFGALIERLEAVADKLEEK